MKLVPLKLLIHLLTFTVSGCGILLVTSFTVRSFLFIFFIFLFLFFFFGVSFVFELYVVKSKIHICFICRWICQAS